MSGELGSVLSELKMAGEWHCLSPTQVLLLLPPEEKIHFKGKLQIRVLSGKLSCLGSVLTTNTPSRRVYSPKGYSLLSLTSIHSGDKKKKVWKLDNLLALGLDSTLAQRIINARPGNSPGCWVLLERLDDDHWTQVLDHYLPHCHSNHPNLFGRDNQAPLVMSEEVERALQVNFYPSSPEESKVRLYKENAAWEKAIQSLRYTLNDLRQPRILITGGKGVGKSTLMRYLTNRILDDMGPVVILDLDPGQAEFSLPGCLSCVKVEEPLLGPNFAHVSRLKHYSLNLGLINVSDAPRRYDRNVGKIVQYCSRHPDLRNLPWIVNTMGFSRGLGVKLIQQTFAKVQPSTVIEIRSRFEKKNYPFRFESLQQVPGFNVLAFEAMPESNEAKDMGVKDLWGIPEPAKLRDIVILSYFGQLYPGPTSSTFIQSVRPFKVSWDHVVVQVLHADVLPQNIPELFNVSLVSLGQANTRLVRPGERHPTLIHAEEEVEAKGFGFVRGVDEQNRLFYVVTPMAVDQLFAVNCLSMGAVILPKGIIVNQKKHALNRAHIPYRDTRISSKMPLSAPWQRYSKPKNFDG